MNAIFAVNSIDGFGVDNTMPWPRSSEDLSRFRKLTTGHTVVMGAKTWLSDMPKPLPNRRNIVLSKTLVDDRCEVYRNITELLMNLKTDEQIYIIGGATLLWTMRRYIKTVYFTRFKSAIPATVTLNTEVYLQDFTLISRENSDESTFDILTRP